LNPMRLEHARIHPTGFISQLLQTKGVRQALRGIDRENANLLAALGEPRGNRRRGGGLADAARAGADADPLPVEDLGDRRHQASRAESCWSAAASSSGLKMNGSVFTGALTRL